MTKLGDCYVLSYKLFNQKSSNKNLRLVHGLVRGNGKLKGKIIDHAWVEDIRLDLVFDKTFPNNFQVLPKKIYYELGKIDEKKVVKYDSTQVLEKSLEFGTYGPWENYLLNHKI